MLIYEPIVRNGRRDPVENMYTSSTASKTIGVHSTGNKYGVFKYKRIALFWVAS